MGCDLRKHRRVPKPWLLYCSANTPKRKKKRLALSEPGLCQLQSGFLESPLRDRDLHFTPIRPDQGCGVSLPPPTSLEGKQGDRGARLTNPVDLNTPSDVSDMSTTSDARLGDRGLRLLTLVERLCKEQRQPHPASAVRKSIPSTSNAGPYLIRTLMHSSTCARDANLVHYHLSRSALRDTARCFGASQRNGQDLEPVSRSR